MAKKKKIIPKEPIEEKPVELTKKQKLWGWFRKSVPTFIGWYIKAKGLPL